MIFICLVTVDLPDSPEPTRHQDRSGKYQYDRRLHHTNNDDSDSDTIEIYISCTANISYHL